MPRADRRRVLAATLLVFAAALALHLVLLSQYRQTPLFQHPVADALSYEQWAERLTRQGLAAEPPFHQSPGYPLLLAGIRRLWPGEPRTATLAVQALLSSLAVALLVPMGRLLLGSLAAGLGGAILALLYGPLAFYATRTLPVTMAMATQAVALVGLAIARFFPGRISALMAGIGLGLACLTRAEMLLFAPVAILAVALPLDGSRRFRPGGVVWLVVGLGLAIAPATAHNLARGDRTLIASAGGENLFCGNQRGATGGHTAIDPRAGDIFSQRRLAEQIAERERGRELDPAEVSRYWRNRALREVAADPLRWLWLEILKLGRVLHPGDPTDLYSFALERERALPVLRALFVPVWTVLLLGSWGLALALRERFSRAWPLAALCAVHLAVLLTFFVSSRLRAPLLFAMTPFAGLAAESVWHRWRSGRRGIVAVGSGLLLVASAVSWHSTNRVPIRERVRLASVLSAADRPAEALRALEPVLRNAPPRKEPARGQYALALDQAGWVLHKEGRLDEAAARYRRAIELGLPAGRGYRTHTRLAQVLEGLGRLTEAARHHDLAVASASADAGTFYERGAFRLRRGDPHGARADLARSVELDPDWPPPRELLRRLD